jgi:hypothetical protein
VGAWYGFLLLLTQPARTEAEGPASRRPQWLVPLAAALVAIGAATPIAAGVPADVFRGSSSGSRSSTASRSMCWARAGRAAFPQYAGGRALEREAALPGTRGGVHLRPLSLRGCAPVRARRRGYLERARPRAYARDSALRAFLDPQSRLDSASGVVAPGGVHSTALIASGAYLLFIAAAGYYVRYFGGNWGRALQVAVIFAGLLALGAMAFSGALRAKLRVIVSKHFFSYRYDYRDEWLRFTQALSARGGQRELGRT